MLSYGWNKQSSSYAPHSLTSLLSSSSSITTATATIRSSFIMDAMRELKADDHDDHDAAHDDAEHQQQQQYDCFDAYDEHLDSFKFALTSTAPCHADHKNAGDCHRQELPTASAILASGLFQSNASLSNAVSSLSSGKKQTAGYCEQSSRIRTSSGDHHSPNHGHNDDVAVMPSPAPSPPPKGFVEQNHREISTNAGSNDKMTSSTATILQTMKLTNRMEMTTAGETATETDAKITEKEMTANAAASASILTTPLISAYISSVKVDEEESTRTMGKSEEAAGFGVVQDSVVASMASRCARLDQCMEKSDRTRQSLLAITKTKKKRGYSPSVPTYRNHHNRGDHGETYRATKKSRYHAHHALTSTSTPSFAWHGGGTASAINVKTILFHPLAAATTQQQDQPTQQPRRPQHLQSTQGQRSQQSLSSSSSTPCKSSTTSQPSALASSCFQRRLSNVLVETDASVNDDDQSCPISSFLKRRNKHK